MRNEKPDVKEVKRPYEEPQLTVFGTVADLTLQFEVGASDQPQGGGGTSIG